MGQKEQNIYLGAVYFRKTAPPSADWERDYAVAQADGHNLFRHWFIWGAIERAPGEYDWADYDRQLDLAAKYNIRTVIGEMIIDSPEWLFHRYPQARLETISGARRTSEMHISCATGGHYAMCLDNPEVAAAAGEFLRQLALRYRDHPGLLGYDIWNECSFYNPERLCYCCATQQRFRSWLRQKYGTVKDLGEAWNRYSYTQWDEVYLPRKVGPYPDVMDAIRFFNDNAFEWMQWRANILKSVDPLHPVIAHGNAKSFSDIAPACGDDWRAAEQVDIFGYTYWYANQCHPLLAADMTRSAANGKPFWRAEAVGGPEWNNRKPGQTPHIWKDAMVDSEEIRLDALISFAGGATGYMNPRWRPLLNGPLFGAYGWYGMDGSRTNRSVMAASIGAWANHPQQRPLWQAQPMRGEVALLLLEEAQAFDYAFYGDTQIFSQCLQGAYEAFLQSNIQCDIIRLQQLDDYRLVYLPYPVALSDSTVANLCEWVRRGGCLVSEACPGYFDETARAFPNQPSRGLDVLFGCQESSISFAPDRWSDLKIQTEGGALRGAIYRQSYQLRQGSPMGWFDTSNVAIVKNEVGQGQTLLVGSMPGFAYKTQPDEATRNWFASLLEWAGIAPAILADQPGNVIARLWRSAERTFLWVINMGQETCQVTLTLQPGAASFQRVQSLRGSPPLEFENHKLTIEVTGRDASVFEIS